MTAYPRALQRCPAALFIRLWEVALQWTETQRLAAEDQPFDPRSAAHLALEQDTAEAVFEQLLELLPANFTSLHRPERASILQVMRAMDDAFYSIHPRAVVPSGFTAARIRRPRWLQTLLERRSAVGHYATFRHWRLIPRGPLLWRPREELESYGDILADRFAALSVVPKAESLNGRKIQVDLGVTGYSGLRGIPHGAAAGRERLAIVPVAEQADDVVVNATTQGTKTFVDFGLAPTADAAQYMLHALRAAGRVDIAAAPEFLMPHKHAESLCDALSCEPTPVGARLIIAGSGLTRDREESRAWNECRVLNRMGTVIARQRKLWPASLDRERAISYGAAMPAGAGKVHENTAAGRSLGVMDIDSLGRCMVLICQDFEGEPLVGELLRHYQPDWVFVPVMDTGVVEGRWCHQRAFGTSGQSHARYLVVSSTALAHKLSFTDPACGAAMGPRDMGEPVRRAFVLVRAESHGAARLAMLDWATAPWQQTTVSANDVGT